MQFNTGLPPQSRFHHGKRALTNQIYDAVSAFEKALNAVAPEAFFTDTKTRVTCIAPFVFLSTYGQKSITYLCKS